MDNLVSPQQALEFENRQWSLKDHCALAIHVSAVDWRTVGASTLLATELNAAAPAFVPSLIVFRAREKRPFGRKRYCGLSATGGRAKEGISQFGSTFRLCFSAISGISHGHGNVSA